MANYVWIKLKNETCINFENNYFDLMAGQTIQIKNINNIELSDLQVSCYQN